MRLSFIKDSAMVHTVHKAMHHIFVVEFFSQQSLLFSRIEREQPLMSIWNCIESNVTEHVKKYFSNLQKH
jgi:hypothetical protein